MFFYVAGVDSTALQNPEQEAADQTIALHRAQKGRKIRDFYQRWPEKFRKKLSTGSLLMNYGLMAKYREDAAKNPA